MDWLIGVAGVLAPIVGVSVLLLLCFGGLEQTAPRQSTALPPSGSPPEVVLPGQASREEQGAAPRGEEGRNHTGRV